MYHDPVMLRKWRRLCVAHLLPAVRALEGEGRHVAQEHAVLVLARAGVKALRRRQRKELALRLRLPLAVPLQLLLVCTPSANKERSEWIQDASVLAAMAHQDPGMAATARFEGKAELHNTAQYAKVSSPMDASSYQLCR
jgi:hypothetical protein